MYHVQISQASERVRAFNLTAEQVHSRFVTPLRGERGFSCEDKEFNPRSTKLIVLEGPQLGISQLSLGRGWTEAERLSREVTEEFLSNTTGTPQPVDSGSSAALKERIFGRLSAGPASLASLSELSADLIPDEAERLTLIHAAAIELLTEGRAALCAARRPN